MALSKVFKPILFLLVASTACLMAQTGGVHLIKKTVVADNQV